MSSKKHTLNTPWTLWHFSTPNQFKPNNYAEYLRIVSTFKNVSFYFFVSQCTNIFKFFLNTIFQLTWIFV